MAEIVERNIENTLKEIAHIRKAKLFNEDEIREIVRHRRMHEYSIQKRNKRISDYDSYIATELGFLRLVVLRRKKAMDYRFRDEIEKSILSRLVRLHRQSCYRFQGHLNVWMRFLLFNRKLGRHMAVVRLWERILQVHGRTDPRLWAAAASFHLNEGCRAQARSCLSKLKDERRALKIASKKLRRLGKNPTCPQERALLLSSLEWLFSYRHCFNHRSDLNNVVLAHGAPCVPDNPHFLLDMETYHFNKLRQSLNHSVQLTWDRTHLRGIREARRLLTQGLSFNEDSVDLLLELLKLEGTAADFFARRVSKRLAKAQELGMEFEEMKSEAYNGRKSKRAQRREREREMKIKEERESSARFISEVSEDVDFVKSGGTFKLVLERFLTFPKATSKHLAAAVEIAEKLSRFADKDILAKLKERQQELHEAEAAEAKRGKDADANKKLGPISLLKEATEAAEVHYKELQVLLDQAAETENDDDIDTALAEWKKWYQSASKSSDLLQIIDPSADPIWMKLLALRIYILVVAKTLAKVKIDKVRTKEEMLKMYQDFKIKQDARVQDTRNLMDLLATSTWGSKVTNFWHLFMEFEEKLGDCSRLPSLRWRAEKCLNEGPRTKLLAYLSTSGGQKMEFL